MKNTEIVEMIDLDSIPTIVMRQSLADLAKVNKLIEQIDKNEIPLSKATEMSNALGKAGKIVDNMIKQQVVTLALSKLAEAPMKHLPGDAGDNFPSRRASKGALRVS